jgi:hypothetical protein
MPNEHQYLQVYGDLHNHRNISYGHGNLQDALANAALRLNFVSISGHADWPDMDADDPRIAHIVDFHQKGFAKLPTVWDQYLRGMSAFEAGRGLVTFPGYEIHSNEHGDYTIVGRDHDLAMTGDLVRLWFSLRGVPMGGSVAASLSRVDGEIDVESTSATDYLELLVNGRREALWRKPVEGEQPQEAICELELGWGERGKIANWQVEIDLQDGEILETIPRFRGPEVVSPLDASGEGVPTKHSQLAMVDQRHVEISTVTWGNLTNSTPSTQGLALRVSSPDTSKLQIRMNERRERYPVRKLLQGSLSGNLGPIDSPAFRLNAISPPEYRRALRWSTEKVSAGWAYIRVRLKNGHRAISSPVWISP